MTGYWPKHKKNGLFINPVIECQFMKLSVNLKLFLLWIGSVVVMRSKSIFFFAVLLLGKECKALFTRLNYLRD